MLRSKLWWLPLGKVPEISAMNLHAKLASDTSLQILDVRTPQEWNISRIEGAINIPITSFRAKLASLGLDPKLPVIAICLSAHRSIPAVRALYAAGFSDICQLEGGMLSWWNAKLPVVKS